MNETLVEIENYGIIPVIEIDEIDHIEPLVNAIMSGGFRL